MILGSKESALASWRAHRSSRWITATAQHAMPSTRPIAPRPSARRPFTVTGASDGVAESALHLVATRRQLRSFAHDLDVDVADRPSLVANDRGHVPQDPDRVGARQLGVGVGEVLPDVAETGGAEQGVGHGVGDGIGVAVPAEPALALERAARRAPARGPDRR